MQLLPGNADIEMPEPIREDMRHFLALAEADETLNPKDFGVQMTREEGVALLRSEYRLA